MVAAVCIQVQISNEKGSVQQNEDSRRFEGQAEVQSHIGHWNMKEHCHCIYNILYRNATSSKIVAWESFKRKFVIAIMTKVLIHPFVVQPKLEPQPRFCTSTKAIGWRAESRIQSGSIRNPKLKSQIFESKLRNHWDNFQNQQKKWWNDVQKNNSPISSISSIAMPCFFSHAFQWKTAIWDKGRKQVSRRLDMTKAKKSWKNSDHGPFWNKVICNIREISVYLAEDFLFWNVALQIFKCEILIAAMLGGAGSLITEPICLSYQLGVESFYGSSLTCFGITWKAQIQLCLAAALLGPSSSTGQGESSHVRPYKIHSSNTEKVKWELQCSQEIVSHQNFPTVRHLPCVPSHLQLACFQHPRHWQGSQMCENMTKYGLGISAPFPTWANSFSTSPSKRIRPVRLTLRTGAICTGAHGFFGAQLGLRKDIVLVTPRSTNFAAKNIVKPGSCLWTANSDDCCTSMISMSSPTYASKCIWLLLQQSGAKAGQELVYLIQPSTKSCTLCGIHSYSCFFNIYTCVFEWLWMHSGEGCLFQIKCSVQRAVEDSFTGSQTLGKYLSRIWALCQSPIPIRLHAAEIQARAHPVLRCNEGLTPKTLPQWHSHTQSHSLKHQKLCSGLKQSSLVQCHTCETRSALLQQKQQTIKF